jgi:hypothetical protein
MTDTNYNIFKRFVIKESDVDVKQISQKTTSNIACRGEQAKCVVSFRLDWNWCLAQHSQNLLKSLLAQSLI